MKYYRVLSRDTCTDGGDCAATSRLHDAIKNNSMKVSYEKTRDDPRKPFSATCTEKRKNKKRVLQRLRAPASKVYRGSQLVQTHSVDLRASDSAEQGNVQRLDGGIAQLYDLLYVFE